MQTLPVTPVETLTTTLRAAALQRNGNTGIVPPYIQPAGENGGIVPPYIEAQNDNPGIVPPWLANPNKNPGIVPPWLLHPVVGPDTPIGDDEPGILGAANPTTFDPTPVA
ncbi:MAG: hypothetical protein KDC46_11490 [Thermoleophilia bacterium]|nr:hypothetical protein [Thermoleophilia bacterium]